MIKQLTFKGHWSRRRSYSCKFASFLKCIFGPKSTLLALLHTADMSTVTRKSEPPNNSQLSLNVPLCCRVPASRTSHDLLSATVFVFGGLLSFLSQKRPPNVELKCYLMLLGSRRLWCASQRKIHVLDPIARAMSYSIVGPGYIILNG